MAYSVRHVCSQLIHGNSSEIVSMSELREYVQISHHDMIEPLLLQEESQYLHRLNENMQANIDWTSVLYM